MPVCQRRKGEARINGAPLAVFRLPLAKASSVPETWSDNFLRRPARASRAGQCTARVRRGVFYPCCKGTRSAFFCMAAVQGDGACLSPRQQNPGSSGGGDRARSVCSSSTCWSSCFRLHNAAQPSLAAEPASARVAGHLRMRPSHFAPVVKAGVGVFLGIRCSLRTQVYSKSVRSDQEERAHRPRASHCVLRRRL